MLLTFPFERTRLADLQCHYLITLPYKSYDDRFPWVLDVEGLLSGIHSILSHHSAYDWTLSWKLHLQTWETRWCWNTWLDTDGTTQVELTHCARNIHLGNDQHGRVNVLCQIPSAGELVVAKKACSPYSGAHQISPSTQAVNQPIAAFGESQPASAWHSPSQNLTSILSSNFPLQGAKKRRIRISKAQGWNSCTRCRSEVECLWITVKLNNRHQDEWQTQHLMP